LFAGKAGIIAGPVKKPVRSGRRKTGSAAPPARRSVPESQGLLARILDTPHLAQVVPRLKPEVLHRVIQTCGLEDCSELVALATPGQLQAVLDLDLWRPPRPGFDEQLDPDRFGQWLEVLMESGAAVAAQKIVGIDVDLVVAALAQHLRVLDVAAASPFTTLDGEQINPAPAPRGWQDCEVGGYRLEATRTDAWDAIVELLIFLDVEHADSFHRIMAGCRRLSNSRPEEDGFHDLLIDTEQDLFDLAVDRDERREKQGYVTPAQARAFLQAARELQLDRGAAPLLSPIAQAYFRAIEWTEEPGAAAASEPPSENAEAAADALSNVVDALLDAGVLPGQPRGLLAGAHDETQRASVLQRLMQHANEYDPVAFSSRGGELAYLANAIVAGCSVQGRPFTASEASDAAAATCNLGLENWSRYWPHEDVSERFLIEHDLVSVFQVGWRVLHADVCLFAADRLVDTLTGLRCDDGEIQLGLVALRAAMSRQRQAGTPWGARGALDVIAILDTPAWAALLGLIDECPVLHGVIGAAGRPGIRSISMSAFEFISGNDQIAAVRAFLDKLPSTLSS
jgi:hypothetical protein